MEIGKIPPQCIEVEQAVLGALMLESEAYYKVDILLNSESFYKNEHCQIFTCIQELAKDGSKIDLLTVTKKIKDKGLLYEIGGPAYITELTSRIVSSLHIEHHAKIIAQTALKRKLIKIGIELTESSFDDNQDVDEIINELQKQINEIESFGASVETGKSQKEVIREALNEMEIDCKNYRSGKPSGVPTGLFDLNKATGGWKPTNDIILASRPGVGKTSLCLHFAESAAKKGFWVNFYGLEMSRSDLMRINISGETGINRTDSRDGRLSDEDWNVINSSIKNMERLPIIWNDQAVLTVNHIRAFTAKNRKAGKCDLIIIDYLQLITPTDKKVNREQQISEISRELKKLALKEKIPIIIAAQLNREATEGEPKLHHLRESGSLEQDADIVIFPWINGNDYTLTIAKHRRGMKGSIIIGHNEEMTRFYDISKFQQPERITNRIEPNDVPF